MPKTKLDIVLPCYNPIPGWSVNILKSIAQIAELLPETELYLHLVNDGSVKEIAESDIAFLRSNIHHFNYIQYTENRGKGFALREGVKQTTNEFCIYTDIDFPYTEESFRDVFKALSGNQADIVVGIRDEGYYAKVPPTRVKISKTLRFFAKKMLALPVNDTQAGLKGFNRRGREIFLETTIDRYLFDLEFLFEAASKPNLRIKPVNVTLKPGIVFSKMNSKILMTEGYSFAKLFLGRPFSRIQKKK